MALTAVAFNCTLKPSPAPSSCGLLLSHFVDEFAKRNVSCEIVRVADADVRPGVSSDEGDGDEWPALRRKVLDADIFVVGTPIWLGHPSSICQRVLERLDALLSEEDDSGRMVAYDRVAICAVVGNEDGAHHVNAEVYQALADVGFDNPRERRCLLDRRGVRKRRLQGLRRTAREDSHRDRDRGSSSRPPRRNVEGDSLPSRIAYGDESCCPPHLTEST